MFENFHDKKLKIKEASSVNMKLYLIRLVSIRKIEKGGEGEGSIHTLVREIF